MIIVNPNVHIIVFLFPWWALIVQVNVSDKATAGTGAEIPACSIREYAYAQKGDDIIGSCALDAHALHLVTRRSFIEGGN
jgi:hypothetical protein